MSAESLTVSRTGPRPQQGHRLALTLARWRRRVQQRSQLAELDALALHDLGLTDADIWRETRKAPWEA